MKLPRLILAGLILLSACKKSSKQDNTSDSKVHPYFKDIIIKETLAGGSLASYQRALGYFPLKSDPNTQIMVASRGREELYDARGFRIASINKSNGTVNWVRSFDLDDHYTIQIETCAAIDQSDNIWVGGHSFIEPESASPFLAKLDKSGNLLWSKSFRSYMGLRAYSLIALKNGDIAFLTKVAWGLAVHRLSADGQSVWSTQITYSTGAVDDDYYTKPNLLSPENHGLVETADGSIYFATSSNLYVSGMGGSERLYKLDANGNLIFARTYRLDDSRASVHPVQLINAGADRILMADLAFNVNAYSPSPYFMMLSLDGNVQASKGLAKDLIGMVGYDLNEVNFYQNNIYFSTCGNYAFNTYTLDPGLNLKSAVKTAAAMDIGTDRGGISLFDETDRALYYVLNFGGTRDESNGFEVTRNDATGKPCVTTYTDPPPTLLLENVPIIAATDTLITSSGFGPAPVFAPLTWRQYQVQVINTENVCGQ